MSNSHKSKEPKLSPYFIAIAAGILIILLAVLLVMSGALDHIGESTAPETTPSETVVVEETVIPETPTPTAAPVYHVYVTCSAGGDAYATTSTVNAGKADRITVIPDVGYSIGSISINGKASGYYGSFDLTDIQCDTVVHVEFVAPQNDESSDESGEDTPLVTE